LFHFSDFYFALKNKRPRIQASTFAQTN